jgi:acyl carrier protein
MGMTTEQEIRSFIVENFLFGASDRDLKDGDSLLEKGIVDSTGVLELVAFLERSYGIKVADEELVPENLDSITNLGTYVARKREGARRLAVPE